MNKYLSIITLNVNRLNAPVKRHSVAEWIRKPDLYIRSLKETHLRTKDLHGLKVKGWKKYSMQMEMKKKAGEAILISDTVDFKTKTTKRNK